MAIVSTKRIGWFITSILPLLVLLTACAQSTATAQVQWSAPVGVSLPGWFSSVKTHGSTTHGQYLAAEAISIASALYGPQTNQYYTDDPTMAPVIAYWKRSCQNADGSLCADAQSGNLQCVEFVSAVFAQIDDELPYGGNASQFWALYQQKADWQEISTNDLSHHGPQLGDIIVWNGNTNGHMAVVVDVQPPTQKNDGFITIAQANAAYPFERLSWHTNGRIDSWPGYQLQGFIRQQEIAPCLQHTITPVTPLQQQWETQAEEAAVHYGIPSKYFLRQLCQSNFQAQDRQGHSVLSDSGAIGIAQLPAQVAAHIPRCVINFLANAQNCDQFPGSLPAGIGINPALPAEAVPAAAYEMSLLYSDYTHSHSLHMPQDEFEAYKLALAAYHTDQNNVDKALSTCGKTRWLPCLDKQVKKDDTSHYINTILARKE